MSSLTEKTAIHENDLAGILRSLAGIIRHMHSKDLELQTALSQALHRQGPAKTVDHGTLQSLDFMTQFHDDLARLMIVLADAADDRPSAPVDVSHAVRLHDLRDRLSGKVMPDDATGEIDPGEPQWF